jgi:hypothetical protein
MVDMSDVTTKEALPEFSKRLQKDIAASRARKKGFLDSVAQVVSSGAVPNLGDIADEWGITTNTIYRWKQTDSRFEEQLNRILTAAVAAPSPDPGPFAQWRREYVNLAKENPYTLRVAHVGETYPFMEPFMAALSDPSQRRILFLAPPRHGKTTIIEHFVVWALCQNPNARILVVCRTQEMAIDRSFAIRQILQDEELYPELHARWGQWIGKPSERLKSWGQTAFMIRGRKSTDRDPSVRCVGVTSASYGRRADFILLDDVDDPTTEDTRRASIVRIINAVLTNRLEEGGRLIYIGTRCGMNDVASHLLPHPLYWKMILPALGDDGLPLCPELYSAEEIAQFESEMGDELFQLVYQQNPQALGDRVFPAELIDSAKGSFDSAPEDWPRIVSLDPAATSRAGIVTIAHNPMNGEIRVLDAEARTAPGYDGLFAMIRDQAARHRPSMFIVEANRGYQILAEIPQIRDYLNWEVGCEIRTFTTGTNRNDPKIGIGLLPRLMRMEKLRFVWADSSCQARLRPLIDDLLAFTPTFTTRARFDTVMALWFACSLISTERQTPTGTAPIVDSFVARRPWIRSPRRGLPV